METINNIVEISHLIYSRCHLALLFWHVCESQVFFSTITLPTYRRAPFDHSSHIDEGVTLSYLVVPYPRFLTTTPGKTVRATQVPI